MKLKEHNNYLSDLLTSKHVVTFNLEIYLRIMFVISVYGDVTTNFALGLIVPSN